MNLKHYSEEKLKQELLKIFAKYIDLKKYDIFIFGSRATEKNFDDRSDIDIGINGKEEVPRISFNKIKDEIENLPILYKIDLVDFYHTTPKFKKIALQKIKKLN